MTTLRERLNKLLFKRVAPGVLKTPPLRRGTEPFTALSMVHHRDVLPWLLAIKSFAVLTRPSRIVVVADPSLDLADRALLRQHVPQLEVVEAAAFRRPALPVGGTWERLAAIAALCAESSVVQLDADTLTLGEPGEALEALRGGTSFIIRSEAGVEIVDLDRAAAQGRERSAASRHVQVAAEARLDGLRDAPRFRYARGCSGFTGFGRGAIDPALLDDVSAQMQAMLGARWAEWGTEQVTSNLLAASAPNAFMLPHPRYCNADSQSAQTRLTHYIGYARFTSRSYERQARQTIRRLAEAGA